MAAGLPGANATARGGGAPTAAQGGGGGRRGAAKPFDAEGEKTIRAALELLKPYMRA